MRVNRWVMLVSLLVGLAGSWFAYDAAERYVAAARAYSSVSVRYVPDSFVWLEQDFKRGRADMLIHNGSDSDATISALALHLYFNGEFAGSRYTPWEPVEIPKGTDVTLPMEFTTSISRLQPQGGTADLGLSGSITVEFEDVNEPLTFPLGGTIGQVSEVEQ